MRAFVGISLPREVGHSIFKAVKSLERRGFRLVEEEKLHLTLKFLGDLNKDELEKVGDALKNLKFKPFTAKIDGKGAFPSKERPRVLWIGVKGNLERLAKNVGAALKQLSLKQVDSKSFSSHLTIGRIKFFSKEFSQGLMNDFERIEIPKTEFTIDKFQLFITRTNLNGWPYEVVKEYYF